MFDIVYFFCRPLLFNHYREDWICHLLPSAGVCTREQALYPWTNPSVHATCSGHPLSFQVFLALFVYPTHDVIRGYRILLVQAG